MKKSIKLLLIVIVLVGTAFYYHLFSFKGIIGKANATILTEKVNRVDFIDNPFNSKDDDYIVIFMTEKGPRYEFANKTEKESLEFMIELTDKIKTSDLTIFVGIGAVVAIVVIALIPSKKR